MRGQAQDVSSLEMLMLIALAAAVIVSVIHSLSTVLNDPAAKVQAEVCAVQCPDAPKVEYREGRCVCFVEQEVRP